VLKYVFQAEKTLVVVALSNRKYFLPAISRTFHGRDVFAPVAAHLSLGLPLESLGEAVDNYIAGQLREPSVNQEGIEGQILYVDRFGNLITNISEALVKQYLEGRAFEICLGNRTITRISRCYSEGSSEEPVAVLGSSGYLEISVNQARADRLLGVKEGDTIRISFIR
ncbi:MAG: SAM-dependent chlorinase/fluorinase, partial [candidate division KSB1 bacterium]|nr:SAM-dependent chlorinase/fluorinase [candidate division KSB1 bacterium]